MRLKRILIANRGEIAARIIKTCRTLGIDTVLAVSEADRKSAPAQLADEVVILGPAPAGESYLNIDAIIKAATETGVDAVHPGYGFLSENAKLVRACDAAGIVFIGPTATQLESIGDKLQARHHALAAGLPVVPGGSVETVEAARKLTDEIGCPVLIKAVGGGGGRGMKLVQAAEELEEVVSLAMAEAEAAFGDSRVYLERYVAHGRHVEVQLLGDGAQVIHLGDRDCSIQRRYQKLVEEAPAPALSKTMRRGLHDSAVTFGEHLGYHGLGTVEFLVDIGRDAYYFLEMNARIQVEHPVTEAVTGLDLVAEQIAVASGQPLWLQQSEVAVAGHAIECRINAEDTHRDFRPSPGMVAAAHWPVGPDVRVDTHIHTGMQVPPYYDSLIGKIIAYGADRAAALEHMRAALGRTHIAGVATNIEMHAALMADAAFADGGVDTRFFPDFLIRHKEIVAARAAETTEVAHGED